MNLRVSISFVESYQGNVDPFFSACGEPAIAGPFYASDDALDWKNQMAPNGNVFSMWSDEAGVCTGPALTKAGPATPEGPNVKDGWVRES